MQEVKELPEGKLEKNGSTEAKGGRNSHGKNSTWLNALEDTDLMVWRV